MKNIPTTDGDILQMGLATAVTTHGRVADANQTLAAQMQAPLNAATKAISNAAGGFGAQVHSLLSTLAETIASAMPTGEAPQMAVAVAKKNNNHAPGR